MSKDQLLTTASVLIVIAIIGAIVFYIVLAPLEQGTPADAVLSEEPSQKPPAPPFDPAAITWHEVTAEEAVPWVSRDSHAVVEFHDRLWLFGGLAGNGTFAGDYRVVPHLSDIWVSDDGERWELVTDTAPWGTRRSVMIKEFQGGLWLTGGWLHDNETQQGSEQNDIWKSSDGAHWEQIVPEAPWAPREGHTVEVFQNKLWIIGGTDFNKRTVFNDIWYSEDGITWNEATSAAPWSARYDHATAVFQDKVWLTGGVAFGEHATNDIWVSEDGEEWELVTKEVVWPVRHGHTALVFKEYMWLISGWDTLTGEGLRDTWYSADGIVWETLPEETPWLGREDHATTVFKDALWLIGGMDSEWTWRKDIWKTETPKP